MYKSEKKKALADLNAELDAMQDYFERTGKSMHILGSVEQLKIIEAWKEKHEEI